MNQLLEFSQQHWFDISLLLVAVAFAGVAFWRMRRSASTGGWFVLSTLFASLGAGGMLAFALGTDDGANTLTLAITFGALLVLFLMLVLLILTHLWSNILAALVGIVFFIGMGALVNAWLSAVLLDWILFLPSLRPLYWWWLVLLVLVPLIIWGSYRSLAGLGPVRKWLAIGLRCAGVILLVLALAETHARRQSDSLTVLFLWDQSLSIPREMDDEKHDLRAERIRTFINAAVARRNAGNRATDQVGLIVFGRWPRLGLPPKSVPELKLRDKTLKRITRKLDPNYTDIGAALKLALASFPEGTGKRLVLFSDGNQNLGDALAQARIAKHNGVQIDVVLQDSEPDKQNEVLVERVEVPPVTEKAAQLPLRIVLRSHHPGLVRGTLRVLRTRLELRQTKQGEQAVAQTKQIMNETVTLQQGLNTFYFQQPGSKKDESYVYKAQFIPQEGEVPGDRVDNNEAQATVLARGEKRVLLIEPKIGDHQLLLDRLRQAKSSLKITPITPEQLPGGVTELAVVLSKFDSVILANIPASSLTSKQQKVFRSNTHDQGCGLIMIGGPDGFGAGGWRETEVEKALPVTCDLKSTEVAGKGGLVLIMHGTEMQNGNFWQKKIAKMAINKLSRADMVGILYWDPFKGQHRWHIPFQQIRGNRPSIIRRLDTMNPGDMPDADPSLKKARNELAAPRHELATKLAIFISDGDHWQPPLATLRDMGRRKIPCTTVTITTHGPGAFKQMKLVAQMTGGKAYNVNDPKKLPSIYMREIRRLSKSFLFLKQFTPQLRQRSGPTEGLKKDLAPLKGFVRTSRRPSPLVNVPIITPKIGKDEAPYPILAHWQYGLGKTVAFTSDARTKEGIKGWDEHWAGSGMHRQFWNQLVEWSLRAVESGRNLNMTTYYKNGKLRITIDARDDNKRPLTGVKLEAGLTTPELKSLNQQPAIKFEQVNAGVYEAEIDADEDGAYFVHVRGKWKDANNKWRTDGVRAGVTVPYSPEFAVMASDNGLLKEIARLTGGNVHGDSAEALEQLVANGEVFRPLPAPYVSQLPVWFWLVLLAGLCLGADIALRRISIDLVKVWATLQNFWAGLRGQPTLATEPQFLDRLKSRKSQIGEGLEKSKAARRFEGDDVPATSPETAATPPRPAAQRRPQQKPKVAPEKEQDAEPADYFSRLQRAKKNVDKDRRK